MLVPKQKTPALKVPTLAHGNFGLSAEKVETFTYLVFYRGFLLLHVRNLDEGVGRKDRGVSETRHKRDCSQQ